MKNYALDTKLLPKVWITWNSSNGRIWMNDKGERKNHPEDWMDYVNENSLCKRWSDNDKLPFGSSWATRNNDKLWVAAGSQLHYAYAKYHKDIDRLELAAVKYDTTRSDGKHGWSFAGDRLFIGRDKSVINQNGLKTNGPFQIKRRGYEVSTIYALRAILRLTLNTHFVDEFKKMLGCNYFLIGNGTPVSVSEAWHFMKWYTSVQKTRSSGKSQKIVDELVKLPLGNIDNLAYIYTPKFMRENRYRGDEYANNIIYCERVNDEWSVLRGLIRNDNNEFDEAWRVYLNDDGTNRIMSKSNDEWVSSAQPRDWDFNHQYYFANPQEAIEKCSRIKYIMPVFEDTDSLRSLITILRFPIIEQLYKLGYQGMALRIAQSSTPKAEIKNIFGDYYNEKEKSVLRQLGMTKHQLDEYYKVYENNRNYYVTPVIKKMRETLGEDLSCIDDSTYLKYLLTFNTLCRNMWRMNRIDNLDVDKCRFWKNIIRLYEKNPNICELLGDTVSTYYRLNEPKPDVDWMFDDYSDVVRLHDALTELANEQDRARRAYWNMQEAERHKLDDARRQKVDEERKHYEYEDENFIIRLPKDVNEIVTEGISQNICIGGYTTRHSKGETNLFFLRRKSDENAPFYAIEMNNDKRIVQIHGFGNRWLGNNPEAIPTVVRWLRKNDIKCDNTILTCTAIGYGRVDNYIPMPVVD